MTWFRRKAEAPQARKAASFFLGLGAGKGALSGAAYDRLAQEGYAQCVVAYASINKIASAVASVEPQLYARGKGGKLAKVESHPLLALLERPNPAQSGAEFMLELAAYHRLAGSAYVLGNGMDPAARKGNPPSELQLLSPGKVRAEPGPGLFPLRYEYRPDASRRVDYPVDQITGASAVLQIKSFNPLSPWHGLSPLWPAALPADIHTGGQRWNLGLLNNGARPAGALVVKDGGDGSPGLLSEEQRQRLEEMLERRFTGAGNAARPMVLEGGLDWREMSINPKDMDFLEGKHSAARDVALAFGVPPQLIGIPGDSTFANYEMAKESFWTETVLPLLAWYLAAFNRWLVPPYGEGLFLWYDEEMVPALEGLRKKKFDRLNAATFLSMNEKRRAAGYDDYQPTENPADTLFVESSKVPLELAGSVPDLAEPGSEADEKPAEDDGADGEE